MELSSGHITLEAQVSKLLLERIRSMEDLLSLMEKCTQPTVNTLPVLLCGGEKEYTVSTRKPEKAYGTYLDGSKAQLWQMAT